MKKGILITAVLAISALALCCGIGNPDEAVRRMNAEERAFLKNRVLAITPDMSEDRVSDLLGPVSRGSGSPRPVWAGPGINPMSQVAVYYHVNGKIFKIRWMKLGSFVWEKNFRETIGGD